MSNQLKSGVSPIAKIAISASLFASLALLEKSKGQEKLAKKTTETIKAEFLNDIFAHDCDEQDVQWVSTTDQLLISSTWQDGRESINVDLLRAAGVTEEQIHAATVKGEKFRKLYVH
jgi:hypothetical protein